MSNENKHKIKGLFIDFLDGTLVNSCEIHYRSSNTALLEIDQKYVYYKRRTPYSL